MYKREIELSGHIIDSLTLPKTMDIIMDNGGDFDILEFDIGKRKFLFLMNLTLLGFQYLKLKR